MVVMLVNRFSVGKFNLFFLVLLFRKNLFIYYKYHKYNLFIIQQHKIRMKNKDCHSNLVLLN